jgi:hypothetical protein
MQLRTQDEKEIKVELMMKLFLENLDQKIKYMNKAGPRSIQKFSEFMMSICVDKILTVPNSNFIQYIPFFIILKAKATSSMEPTFNKLSCCENLFTTCFISILINRSFPTSDKTNAQPQ